MSLEMAQKVIVPQKKIMSRSFLNSGTLIVKNNTLWPMGENLFRALYKRKQIICGGSCAINPPSSFELVRE